MNNLSDPNQDKAITECLNECRKRNAQSTHPVQCAPMVMNVAFLSHEFPYTLSTTSRPQASKPKYGMYDVMSHKVLL